MYEGDTVSPHHCSSDRIVDISQWGCVKLGNKGHQFRGCSFLRLSATDAPDLPHITHLNFMFAESKYFDGDMTHWDTSNVVDMNGTFACCPQFNGDVSGWNTSKVVDMGDCFSYASAFNGDISQWDVSSVRNMRLMFYRASAFTGHGLSQWDTSKVSIASDTPNTPLHTPCSNHFTPHLYRLTCFP